MSTLWFIDRERRFINRTETEENPERGESPPGGRSCFKPQAAAFVAS